MLPSHLRSTSSSGRPEAGAPGGHRQAHALGVTGVMCRQGRVPLPHRRSPAAGSNHHHRRRGCCCSLHYVVYRPRHLAGPAAGNVRPPPPPLFVVAGGPLLSHHYLTPLVHVIDDRAVVLYDQAGCGRSVVAPEQGRSSANDATDVGDMVEDLQCLIGAVLPDDGGVRRPFHLAGHSFGGIVAYEWVRKFCSAGDGGGGNKCLSLTLCSAPSSLVRSRADRRALCSEIAGELQRTGRVDGDGGVGAEDGRGEGRDEGLVARTFFRRHACRVDPVPLPLQQSLDGLRQLREPAAHEQDYDVTNRPYPEPCQVPALIVSTQHDFLSPHHAAAWKRQFQTVQQTSISNAAHYGMVENEELYGTVLLTFLKDHDR